MTANDQPAAQGRGEIHSPGDGNHTPQQSNERSAASTSLYVSVRYVKLRRSYNAVHRTRDCRQLAKGARKIAELPPEWASFLPACTACFPRGAWSMRTPAPPELFDWYMEAHRAA